MYDDTLRKNKNRKKLVDVAQMLIDEMSREIKYSEDYSKIYEKAENEARKNDGNVYRAWDYVSWENKEKFSREPKGDAWFKRRAMMIREMMLDIYNK